MMFGTKWLEGVVGGLCGVVCLGGVFGFVWVGGLGEKFVRC